MITAGNDKGLSEVVGFMLIIGLLVIALAAYQIYEVPAIGRNNEIEHMNYIKDRFVDYKISLDSLWINSVEKEDYYDPITGVTLSTSMDMGTEGGFVSGGDELVPVLTPISSAGSLTLDGNHGRIKISADGYEIVNTSLGILEYSSENNYWVDQDYYYQMGGVFLRQDDGAIVIRADPPLSIYNVGGNAAVQVTPVNVTGDQMIAGSGPVMIESRLRSMPQYMSSTLTADYVELKIYCEDAAETDVWTRVINNALQREGTTSWCTVDTNYITNIVTVTINGPGDPDDVTLEIYRADFAVWLQNVATELE